MSRVPARAAAIKARKATRKALRQLQHQFHDDPGPSSNRVEVITIPDLDEEEVITIPDLDEEEVITPPDDEERQVPDLPDLPETDLREVQNAVADFQNHQTQSVQTAVSNQSSADATSLNQKTCVICFDPSNKVNHVCIPCDLNPFNPNRCGHLAFCESCAKAYKEMCGPGDLVCPMCRYKPIFIHKVF